MAKKSDWGIDPKTLSHQQIVEVIKQLKDSGKDDIVVGLRRELVDRLRARGKSDGEIIRHLSFKVPRGEKLNAIAEDWAKVFGVSKGEFKRIADLK